MSIRGLLKNEVELEKDWWMKDVQRIPHSAKPLRRPVAKPSPIPQPTIPELLTYAEVQKHLRISMTTLYELIHEGEFEIQPVRGKRLIRASEISQYLERERLRIKHG